MYTSKFPTQSCSYPRSRQILLNDRFKIKKKTIFNYNIYPKLYDSKKILITRKLFPILFLKTDFFLSHPFIYIRKKKEKKKRAQSANHLRLFFPRSSRTRLFETKSKKEMLETSLLIALRYIHISSLSSR